MSYQHNFALSAFRTVAELKNFSRAAARLNISPSALSQTIKQLEGRLNMRLFHRTTRSVNLTEAGQSLLVRIAPLLDEIEHVFDELKQAKDLQAGPLKLTMPYIVWQTLICPALPAFSLQYPLIELDIHISDALVDIVREGYDAGIRVHNVMHQDMVALPVGGDMHSAVVGSRDYFDRHSVPQHPYDLREQICINYRFQTGGTLYPWRFQKNDEIINITPGGMALSEEAAMVQAAKAGLGIANVFAAGIYQELASGDLIAVLQDWQQPVARFYLYYPSRQYLSPRLSAFIEYLRALRDA